MGSNELLEIRFSVQSWSCLVHVYHVLCGLSAKVGAELQIYPTVLVHLHSTLCSLRSCLLIKYGVGTQRMFLIWPSHYCLCLAEANYSAFTILPIFRL